MCLVFVVISAMLSYVGISMEMAEKMTMTMTVDDKYLNLNNNNNHVRNLQQVEM